MSKTIIAAEFEALKDDAYEIVKERDIDCAYENLINRDGNEFAFASYRNGCEPTYTLREA